MERNIEKAFAFLIEIDKMKTILRRSLTYDGSKREDDAEHSWHLAMMALILEPYAPEPVDITRVLKMTLVHDLVEIYAGDTFAFDVKGHEDKAARETAAADKLFSFCEEAKPLRALWEEFDAAETPDAKFAASLDRIQPLISNHLNNGFTWVQGNVTRAQVDAREEVVKEGLPAAWDYVQSIIENGVKNGTIKP